MGLTSLGRGRASRAVPAAVAHVAGAALGGAVIGALLAAFGSLLSLSAWRVPILGVAAVLALKLGRSRTGVGLGLQRQVPRSWDRWMSPGACYLLWGWLLGTGVATTIPYSLFLLVLAAQLTSGAALAALAGALYGTARESVAVVPLACGPPRMDNEKILGLLPSLRAVACRANTMTILLGASALLATSWWGH